MKPTNPLTSFRWIEPLDINGVGMLGIAEKQGYAFSRYGYLVAKIDSWEDADVSGREYRASLRPLSHSYLNCARTLYKNRVVPDFPFYFIIEPVGGICNRACPFCSISVVNDNRKGMMKWKHFTRLMQECGQHETYGLSLYQLGEPFLYKNSRKNIADMVNYAKAVGGFKAVNLSTNGDVSNLNLVLTCDLDDLIISIDGTIPEVYSRNRPSTRTNDTDAFRRTVQTVRSFLELKIARNSRTPWVRLQIINNASTRDQILDFIRYWIDVPGVDDVFVKELDAMTPWVGEKAVNKNEAALKMAEVSSMPCQHLWAIGSVVASGQINACCHDARTELTNDAHIENTSFYNWWHGKYITELREKHISGEFPMPCAECQERDCWLG